MIKPLMTVSQQARLLWKARMFYPKLLIVVFGVILLLGFAFANGLVGWQTGVILSTGKVSGTYSSSVTLYYLKEDVSSTAYVTSNYLTFMQQTEVSAFATTLESGPGDSFIGDTICPTNVTVKGTTTGYWADNSFSSKVVYYYGCAPPSYSTTPKDVAIRFHNNDYDLLKQYTVCHDYDPCFNHEGTLTDTKIDEYYLYEGDPTGYKNALGRVSYTCAGNNYLKVTTPAAGTLSPSGTASGTGATSMSGSRTVELLQDGTYTFEDTFDIRGCVAVVRFPRCEGMNFDDEGIYYAATKGLSNQQEYKRKDKNTFTVTVANRQNSLQYLSHSPSGTLILPKGQPVLFKVTVKNNGNVKTMPYDAASAEQKADTSSGPYKFYAFSVSKYSQQFCQQMGGINCPSSDGFGTYMNPGETRDLYFYITASNTAPLGYTYWQNGIILSYKAASDTCNGKDLTMPLSVYREVTNGTSDAASCIVAPNSAIMNPQESRQFSLTCYNSQNSVVSCPGSTAWTLQGLSGQITSSSPAQATVWVTGKPGATGNLNASVSSTVSCAAALTINSSANLSDAVNCTITPSTANVGQYEVEEFNVTCRNANNQAVQCTGGIWNLVNLIGGFLSTSDSNALLYVESAIGSKGILNYSTTSISCTSDLTVVTPTCTMTIYPPSWSITVGNGVNFTTSCQCLGTVFDCGAGAPQQSTQWYIMPNGLSGTLSGTNNTAATFTGTAVSSGRIRAYSSYLQLVAFTSGSVTNATTPDNPQPPRPGDTVDCRIRPNPAELWPGVHYRFTVWCGKDYSNLCPSDMKITSSAGVTYLVALTTGEIIGADLIVNQPIGKYTITANYDNGKKSCYAEVNVGAAKCWEFA